MNKTSVVPFDGYQKFVVAMLTFLQFTIILDFMIISPLGATMMPDLHISPAQFGFVVSVYAFSAGAAGLLAAGFADRYDRKSLLLFFYTGFLIGTLLCGVAPTYDFLVFARLVTGLFGGVIGSIVAAITTDLFPLEMRGRVMGFIQTAFAGSQVLGLPVGLFLSNHWGWHAPFLMIVAVGVGVGVLIAFKLESIDGHLKLQAQEGGAVRHLWATLRTPRYLFCFAATALLSLGGFMLMPFGSAFTVHNLGIALENLPVIYLVSGCCSMAIGPLVGRASDRFGKWSTFVFGSVIGIVMAIVYTHMGPSSLGVVILVNALMFLGVFSRMIPAQALMSGVPEPVRRGSFMAVGSSLQQVAGGFASILAGAIVTQTPEGHLEHFDTLGWVLVGSSLVSLVMIRAVDRMVTRTLEN